MDLRLRIAFSLVTLMAASGCGHDPGLPIVSPAEERQIREQLNNIEITGAGCFPDGARGTVTNNNSDPLPPDYLGFEVAAVFYDDNGEELGWAGGPASVDPGDKSEWALPSGDSEGARMIRERIRGYATCEIRRVHWLVERSPDDVRYQGSVVTSEQP